MRQRYLHRRVARALAEVYEADIESWNGQIASHFEQAGMAEEAIEYYRRAAAYARQRYADTEAAELLRRALALCRGFSESDRRLKQELDLLVMLGPALVTTEGYSAAEVGETYERALELSRRLDGSQYFRDSERRLGVSHRAGRSGKSAAVRPRISESRGAGADAGTHAGRRTSSWAAACFIWANWKRRSTT